MSDTPIRFSVLSHGFHWFRLFIRRKSSSPRLHGKTGTSLGCDTRRAVAESRWALGVEGYTAAQSEEQVETCWEAPTSFPASLPSSLSKKKGCPVTKVWEVHVDSMVSELTPIFYVKKTLTESHRMSNRAHMQHRKMPPTGVELEEGHPAQGPMHFSSISVGH